MSGQKTSYVTMEQREERRLRQMETNFRAVQNDLPETLRSIRNDVKSQLDRQREATEARLSSFARTAETLKSELGESERRQQRRLRDGLEKVHRQMSDEIAGERADREQQAAAMQAEYRNLIAEERNERQKEIDAIQNRLETIENRDEKRTQMAAAWLADLRVVMAEVGELQHERFAPGKLERIIMRVEQAENNLAQGAPETALGAAQSCYLDLIELRAEVLYREQVFEQAFLKAIQRLRELLAEVKAHEEASAFADTEKEFTFKVDFWSGGKLAKIESEISELEQRLEAEKAGLTLEQVQIVDADLDRIRLAMLDAVEAAKIAIINSQACFNVSQIVENVLASQGYQVIEGVYEGEDERSAYGLKMKNRVGDEVVTVITPSPDRELQYKMQMNFFDTSRDEAMRQDFVKSVQNGLNQEGLQSEPSRTTRDAAEEPDESVRDFESFRRRRNTEKRVL